MLKLFEQLLENDEKLTGKNLVQNLSTKILARQCKIMEFFCKCKIQMLEKIVRSTLG
jgi:hypothetical protein